MFELLAFLLSTFFGFTKSYGVAIILLTVVVRLALFPLTAKQMRSMNAMAKAQPEIRRLQAEYGDDKQKLNEEMMRFYKQQGINPAAGCLPLLLQIPVFIGLFRVIRGLSSSETLHWLGVRVARPQYLDEKSEMFKSIVRSGGRLQSFGIDLAQSAGGTRQLPYIALVVIYAASGWVQQSLANKKNPAATSGPGAQMQQIMKVFPIFMGIFSYSMPAGLVLYWFASNLWTIGQQEVLHRTIPRVTPETLDSPEPAKGGDAAGKEKPGTGSRAASGKEKPAAIPQISGKPKPTNDGASAPAAPEPEPPRAEAPRRPPKPARPTGPQGSLFAQARAAAEAKAAARAASGGLPESGKTGSGKSDAGKTDAEKTDAGKTASKQQPPSTSDSKKKRKGR